MPLHIYKIKFIEFELRELSGHKQVSGLTELEPNGKIQKMSSY